MTILIQNKEFVAKFYTNTGVVTKTGSWCRKEQIKDCKRNKIISTIG